MSPHPRTARARAIRLAACALLALTASAQARTAHAAACCGPSHGLGEALGRFEVAGAGLGARFTERLAGWTADHEVLGIGAGSERELRLDATFQVRASERLQLGADLPWLTTWKDTGRQRASGGGVGDALVSGRYDLLWHAGHAPGVAVTLAALLPTGRGFRTSTDPLAADITGLGTAELRPGFVVEELTPGGWLATLGGSVGLRRAYRERTGSLTEPAPSWIGALTGGHRWDDGATASVGLLVEGEAAPTLGGKQSPKASRLRTSAVAAGAYDFAEGWMLSSSVELDLPVAGLGRNEPIALRPALGLRHVWN